MDLIEIIFNGKVFFILHVMIGMLSLPLMQSEIMLWSFLDLHLSLSDGFVTLPPFTDLTDKVLSNIIITEQEIKNIIDTLDTNKASGPDLISNKMIDKKCIKSYRHTIVYYIQSFSV